MARDDGGSREPYLLASGDVVALFCSNPDAGLSGAEAEARLKRFGQNRLTGREPIPAWWKFVAQFSDILVLLLIAAAFISAVIWFIERDSALPYEALAILSIVLLNAIMGFVQQARAEEALKALRDMSAPQATVVRGGERHRIASALLVPGDIVLIEEGDTIPADARLIESISLQTAEASLTGESLPVAKDIAPLLGEPALGDRRNMLFSGTAAVGGRGRAVVTATGMQTETGRIASMLEATPDEDTPLQKELDRVGRLLGGIVVVIAVVMIATILLMTELHGISAIFGVLILGVALAVAAVPEGLPAIVTAVLSLGVQRMAKRKAIVRRLAAVETLGSADVIASDKTGTLTRNEMTVRRIATASGQADLEGSGYSPEGAVAYRAGGGDEPALISEVRHALRAAECANNALLQEHDGQWSVQGDPTEGALLTAARKVGLTRGDTTGRFKWVAEIPFSSDRKLMTTVHSDAEEGHLCTFTKGAPDVLLAHCSHEFTGSGIRPLKAVRRAEILAANEALATDALRTLAVACSRLAGDHDRNFGEETEQELTFIGLIGMIDPPRDEARAAVARAKAAGIRVVMITGDHPKTASVIAGNLGITSAGGVVTGAELAKMPQDELDRTVRGVSIYARVDPVHKLRIVGALKRQGATIAMTGDGVNDAPALKAADIGIAMGITGTDVSKGASDIVLADDNFATILAAVEEGRAIFSNIRKFLRYLLSSNIGEVMTMFFGVVFAGAIGLTSAAGDGLVLPLLATQILWINLVTDGMPALALGIDPASEHTMNRPPRAQGEGVITGAMWRGIFLVGTVMAAGTLAVLDACLPGGLIEGSGDIDYGRTMAFTTLTLFQLFNVFNARSDERSLFDDLFANRWLWAAVAFSLALHAAVIYLPLLQDAFSTTGLGIRDWLFSAAVASSVLWLRELTKLVRRYRAATMSILEEASTR